MVERRVAVGSDTEYLWGCLLGLGFEEVKGVKDLGASSSKSLRNWGQAIAQYSLLWEANLWYCLSNGHAGGG